MNESERVALAWVEKRLRIFECPRCHKTWITARSTAALMHRCAPPPRPLTRQFSPEEYRDEDRKRWARTQISTELERGLGDRAYLAVEESPA